MTNPQNHEMVEASQVIKQLQDQLDLANSRMQSANHAFQVKTNDALELHAQFLLVQKKNADLMKQMGEQQKVVDALQKQVLELTKQAEEKLSEVA